MLSVCCWLLHLREISLYCFYFDGKAVKVLFFMKYIYTLIRSRSYWPRCPAMFAVCFSFKTFEVFCALFSLDISIEKLETSSTFLKTKFPHNII